MRGCGSRSGPESQQALCAYGSFGGAGKNPVHTWPAYIDEACFAPLSDAELGTWKNLEAALMTLTRFPKRSNA